MAGWLLLLFFSLGIANAEESNPDKEWLEGLLKKYENERATKNVLSVEILPKGNETDIRWESRKAVLKLEKNSGKVVKKYGVIYSVPETEYRRKLVKNTGLFKKDILMYKKVLPLMENLMEEFGDKSERMWIKPFGFSENDDKYVLQDIESYGYMRHDRQEGLDMDHVNISLKSLAKFHAMSAVLHERGLLPVEDFDKHVLQTEGFKMYDYFDHIIDNVVKSMEEKWGPEWSQKAKDMSQYGKLHNLSIKNWYTRNETAFNVLNHGSFDINNIYFTHGITDAYISKKPLAMKTSGFQLAFFNTPAFDLQTFLFSSINVDTMVQRKQYVDTYHNALVEYLLKFNYKGKPYTPHDLMVDMMRTDYVGFVQGMNQYSFMYMDDDNKPDMEALAKISLEKQELPVVEPSFYSEKYIKNMMKLFRMAFES